MNLNDLFKKYKYEVTDQDEIEYSQNTKDAIEELIDNLQHFNEVYTADMTFAYIIQSLNDYVSDQINKFEQRKNSKSSFDNNVEKELSKYQ